jgi:hypothetical protein
MTLRDYLNRRSMKASLVMLAFYIGDQSDLKDKP